MIGLGIIEVFLSQIPNFHNLSWLSIIAAIMSFGYAFIGIGLSLATIIQGKFSFSLVISKFFVVVVVVVTIIIIIVVLMKILHCLQKLILRLYSQSLSDFS
jgi:hypothetical protein